MAAANANNKLPARGRRKTGALFFMTKVDRFVLSRFDVCRMYLRIRSAKR